MESIRFTDEDITLFLKKQIEATGDFKVDDSPDRFVRMVTDTDEEGEIKTLTDTSGVPHPVAIFGTVSPDAIIINPLAEGSSDSSKQTWWYATCNACLASMVYKLMQHLITESEKATAVKPKKGEKAVAINTAVVELASSAAMDIDGKTSKELASIVGKDLNSFFGIHYDKSTKTSRVKCTILNEAQRKAHSTVRVKTWRALENLLYAILGTKDMSEFEYKATLMEVPVFESYSHVQLKVLEKLAAHAGLIGKKIKELGSLSSCIKYIPQYHNRAKWQISSPVADTEPEKTAPWQRAAPSTRPVPPIAPRPQMDWTIQPLNATTYPSPVQTAPAPMQTTGPNLTPGAIWARNRY